MLEELQMEATSSSDVAFGHSPDEHASLVIRVAAISFDREGSDLASMAGIKRPAC